MTRDFYGQAPAIYILTGRQSLIDMIYVPDGGCSIRDASFSTAIRNSLQGPFEGTGSFNRIYRVKRLIMFL